MKPNSGKEAGAPASVPRGTSQHTTGITNDLLIGDKNISILAVKSVASQYGIDVSLFKNWLEKRGFQISEEAIL